MPTDFVTVDFVATLAGVAFVVGLIVQFTKSAVKSVFSDQAVRLYAFVWSLIIVFLVAWRQGAFAVDAQEIATQVLLCLINAILVTLTAMGGYDGISDWRAEKEKPL